MYGPWNSVQHGQSVLLSVFFYANTTGGRKERHPPQQTFKPPNGGIFWIRESEFSRKGSSL